MEERKILKFQDEEGNVVSLEAMAEIYLDEIKYLILAPVDDNATDEYVYRVDVAKDGTEELNAVDDDSEFMKVKKEYKNLLYGDGGKNE
ncbi:MAG: DUF1292 domain-containing protein [Clostridium sp.]|jgi:uncharacterized protein YrzB (UPF0473 family)|nr:DUF1292 domain-containing protein [Clostridium sp.]